MDRKAMRMLIAMQTEANTQEQKDQESKEIRGKVSIYLIERWNRMKDENRQNCVLWKCRLEYLGPHLAYLS